MSQLIEFKEPQYSTETHKPLSIPTNAPHNIPPRIGPWVIRRANSEGDVHWSNVRERKPSLARLMRNIDDDCALMEKLAMSTAMYQNGITSSPSVVQTQQRTDGRRRTYPCDKTSSGEYCQICGFVGSSRCAPVKEEIEDIRVVMSSDLSAVGPASRLELGLKMALIFSGVLNLVFVVFWAVALFSDGK